MNKAYTYELNLLACVLSMALKLSHPLTMSIYFERIALYAEQKSSKGDDNSNNGEGIEVAYPLFTTRVHEGTPQFIGMENVQFFTLVFLLYESWMS